MRKKHLSFHRALDWWSVPHFLFGMVVALGAFVFSLPVLPFFFATLILALFWELLEKRYRIDEASGNTLIDILLPLIAFVITLFLVDQVDANPEHYRALFAIVFLLYIAINFFAWRARFERDGEFLG